MRHAIVGVVFGLIGGCFPSVPDKDAGDTGIETDTGEGCTSPTDCQHLAGACIEVLCLDNTCATRATDQADCDDGIACTKGDTCSGFQCAGEIYACDDGLECTDDMCDGEGGCDYPASEGACHIGPDCFVAGDVNALDPCRVCMSGESWSPNDGAPCDDGDDVCSIGDTCEGMSCKPGELPDDRLSDWESGVVALTSPAEGGVLAVAFTGIGDSLMITEVAAKGVETPFIISDTSPATSFSGDALFGVRRTATTTYRNFGYDGFDDVDLVGMSSLNGIPTVAVNLEGNGSVTVQDATTVLTNSASHVLTLSITGGEASSFSLPYEIAAVSHRGTLGGAYVARSFFQPISVNGIGSFSPIEGTDRNHLVLGMSDSGAAVTAVQLGVSAVGPAGFRMCSMGQEAGLVVSSSFRGDATIRTALGDIVMNDPDSSEALLLMNFDDSAHLGLSGTPIHNPSGQLLVVDSLACRSDGSYVGTVPGLGVVMKDPRPEASSAFESSVVGFTADHEVEWAVNATGLGFLSVDVTADGVVAWAVRPSGADEQTLSDRDGVHQLPLAGGHLVRLDRDGRITWTNSLERSQTVAAVRTLNVSPSGSVIVGGFYIGSEIDLGTADDARLLMGDALLNPFAATFNSSNGRACIERAQ